MALGDRRTLMGGWRGHMSFVIAQPDLMSAAATNLANIGSAITEANAAAAGQTTAVLAAGAREGSAARAAGVGRPASGSRGLPPQARGVHRHVCAAARG